MEKENKSIHPLTWEIPLVDSGDGSGDLILEFPPELLEHTGWKEGDVLEIDDSQLGKVFLRKKD